MPLTVVDPGFLEGGANPRGKGQQAIIWHNFCQKLHENEGKIGRGWGREVPRAPPRSATDWSVRLYYNGGYYSLTFLLNFSKN